MLIVRCVCPCNSVFPLSHTLLLFLSISISRTRTHQALLGTSRNERTGQVDYEHFLQQMEGDNRFHRTSQHMFHDRGFATGTNLLKNVNTFTFRKGARRQDFHIFVLSNRSLLCSRLLWVCGVCVKDKSMYRILKISECKHDTRIKAGTHDAYSETRSTTEEIRDVFRMRLPVEDRKSVV